jgi:hypothetical protein
MNSCYDFVSSQLFTMPPDRQTTPRELIRLFRRLWWLKVSGITLFVWVFFIAYFFLLRYPHPVVTTMPLSWLDTALPMQWWAWIPYLSLWFYTGLPAAFTPGLRTLVYYGLAVAMVCGLGLLCFYLWPTAIPVIQRPPGTELAVLEGVDMAQLAAVQRGLVPAHRLFHAGDQAACAAGRPRGHAAGWRRRLAGPGGLPAPVRCVRATA